MSWPPVRILLNRLIDYAGLFPPAALSMPATVRNYAAYRRGSQAWALGRLVLPVARLDEFAAAAAELPPPSGAAEAWYLSALCGSDLPADLARIDDFCRRHEGRMVIDSLEFRPADDRAITGVKRDLLADRKAYVEISPGEGVEQRVEAIRQAGLRAKIRTGGLTPESIPAVNQVYAFLRACHQSGVAFKATAGLHHPVRGVHFLAVAPDGPRGRMHGFLNLFLAAAFMRQGLSEPELLQLIDEPSAKAFHCDEEAFHWRGRRLDTAVLARVRHTRAIAFGSCSFVDPMDDLTAMRML